MLRHTGQRRTYLHNVRLAVLLSLSAGFVNAAGFMAFAVLTTNVTGHAALLAVHIAQLDTRAARMVALWLLLFLAGAFTSGLFISRVGRDRSFAYSLPLLGIAVIIAIVAAAGHSYHHRLPETEWLAGSLLFSMGMQNALVSVISGSVVRTTHLTGMVTDLGIDLSAILSIPAGNRSPVARRIVLHVSIIFSFLAGGVAGAIGFKQFAFSALYIPCGLIGIALTYDYLRVKMRRWLHAFFPPAT
jgi:uncharacterized membrane protein YoaK (UPF0700 family)